MADTTSMDSVLKLLQSFSGKGSTQTTSGGTQTQQTQLSQDTINATLKSALESNQGLASLAAGQNNSGMYNSTTNQQLSNDLLSRLTTEAAVKGAPTTITKSPTTVQTTNPGMKDSLLPMLGLAAGKKYIDKAFSGDLFSSGASNSSLADSGIGAILEGHGGMDAAFNMAGSRVSDAVANLGSDSLASAGSNILDSFVSGGGSSAVNEVAGDAAESAGTSLTAVVCTESFRQGLMSHEHFRAETLHFATHKLNSQVQDGYHLIGKPIVLAMRNSRFVARFFAAWANKFIAGECMGRANLPHKFVKYALFPVCWVIGTVAPASWIPAMPLKFEG